jgi:Tfp pilus assembly protein FimT
MVDTSQQRGPSQRQAGFSLAELTVLLAVIGALFSLSLPVFVTYYQSARVRGAAADVAAYVNQGRQLAIQLN